MQATFADFFRGVPTTGDQILVKDAITDAFLQQILTRPDEFDVIATLNLNGDYLSDALAAQGRLYPCACSRSEIASAQSSPTAMPRVRRCCRC